MLICIILLHRSVILNIQFIPNSLDLFQQKKSKQYLESYWPLVTFKQTNQGFFLLLLLLFVCFWFGFHNSSLRGCLKDKSMANLSVLHRTGEILVTQKPSVPLFIFLNAKCFNKTAASRTSTLVSDRSKTWLFIFCF